MNKILKNISIDDLEKLQMLLTIIPESRPKQIVTLRMFVIEYSKIIKQNKSKAYHVSVNSSFKHLTEFFGCGKSIQSIGLKDVEKFMLYLQRKVIKGFRVYYRTIKAAFNMAKDWGYVSENYFQRVRLPKKQQVNPVFMNSDELSVICNQLKNETIKDIVVFAFYTGMRLNEIVNLKWKNVELRNRIITVGDESFTTKGRNQRYIPICDEAEKVIENVDFRIKNEKQRQPDKQQVIHISKSNKTAYVFRKSDGHRFTGDYISKRFKLACKTAGVDQSIHFHSLRHSFASNLVQKGVPLYSIKELLGHSSISTTEIYSHLNMESLREAIKKLDTSSEMLDTRQMQKPNNEENSRLQIFSINSGEKR